MKLAIIAALVLWVSPVAAEEVVKIHAGANVVWFDDMAKPSDVELGGTVGASLSQHISIVGGAWFGIDKSYLRGTVGPRITVSDPANKDLSIGLGFEYQASSEPVTRSEEWTGLATIGLRPWPQVPQVVIGAQAGYGMDTGDASLLVGVRYRIGGYR